jgi:hypothetical protein
MVGKNAPDMCLLCHKDLPNGVKFMAVDKWYVDNVLNGVKPPRRAAVRGPQGQKMWGAHIDCVRATSDVFCPFCGKGVIDGDNVAAIETLEAARVLGHQPPDNSISMKPLNSPRCIAHLECATSAGLQV